jgi:hypothetical protein
VGSHPRSRTNCFRQSSYLALLVSHYHSVGRCSRLLKKRLFSGKESFPLSLVQLSEYTGRSSILARFCVGQDATTNSQRQEGNLGRSCPGNALGQKLTLANLKDRSHLQHG